MIALEHKETMQRICEAPVVGLKSKGFLDLKEEIYGSAHSGKEGNIVEQDRSSSSSELRESSNEFYKNTPACQHEFGSWVTFHPDSNNNVHLCQVNAFEGQLFPVHVDNRFHYAAPFNIFHQSYPYEYQFQDFHYFVVIDFEATCDKSKNPHPQEIIEFPSVIVSTLTGQLEACFQTYVRPTCNQMLSDFCKDLTGIQQIQVDRGVTLSEALLRHDKWLEKKGIKNSNFAVVTWSNWDCRVMLESECRYKKIRKPPYFNRWINLKVPFREVFGGVRCNLKEAVQMAGLAWQGRAHCGLDDAKNTARLLALLMRKGFRFSITNSMMCHQSNAVTSATSDYSSVTWQYHHQQQPQQFKLKETPPHHNSPPQHVLLATTATATLVHFQPCCYCGVKSLKSVIRQPGPNQGNYFFGCGNWNSTRGASCNYFEWASA
jgi:ERI1 exoribonuclease 2